MFARRLTVTLQSASGTRACPLKYLDSFAMRSFTGESRFDETLPVDDGLLEASRRVSVAQLRDALQDWFRRKSYLLPGEQVTITEAAPPGPRAPSS